jgi:hypothetical protein
VTETVALLAARAPKLRQAVWDAKKTGYPFAVLDGTLVRTDQVAADRPFFSGRHHCHGMNLQVLAGPLGHQHRRPPGDLCDRGPANSGVIGINGAAAHLVHPEDLVIIVSFVSLDDAEARAFLPRVVHVDAGNHAPGTGADIAEPAPGTATVRGDIAHSG